MISKYYGVDYLTNKKIYIVINHENKTFQFGYTTLFDGKWIGKERVLWLVEDCKKSGYKET